MFRSLAGRVMWLAAIFLSLIASTQAQTPVQELKPALWAVSDEDTTIYLFGTVHALPKGMHWLDGKVASALDSSDELVTELPEIDPLAMQATVMNMGILPVGQSLRAQLRHDARASYEKAMVQAGMPVSSFDRYEPWYAAIALGTIPVLKAGYDPDSGVEAVLASRMKELKRPRVGLETAEFQLGIFDKLPIETQKSYLKTVAEKLPEVQTEIDQMVNMWMTGDADALAQIINEDESDPAMKRALLTDRNQTWAEWIKARMDRPGKVFLAVGAGHLAGPGSVQDQLAAKGFKVVRVQ